MSVLVLVNASEHFSKHIAHVANITGMHIHPMNDAADRPVTSADIVSAGPHVVVVSGIENQDRALEIIEDLSATQPAVSSILVATPTAEVWQRALRAGARDLLSPEAPELDLHEAVSRAAARRAQTHDQIPLPEAPDQPVGAGSSGRILTLVSPKGGSGKTMLATNIAHGLQTSGAGRVVVVDFDLQFGDISFALGIRPEYTLSNAINAAGDPTATKSFLTPHPSGLFVLCAPANPAEADHIEPESLAKLLHTLKGEFDWVVVDTSAGVSEANLTAIECATDVVVTATTDLAAIQAMRKAVVVLDQIGLTSHRRWYVLNRANARVGVDQSDIERSVGLAIDATVPSSRSVPLAMNQGIPVIEDDPRSPAAKAIRDFISKVAPTTNPAPKGWLDRIRS